MYKTNDRKWRNQNAASGWRRNTADILDGSSGLFSLVLLFNVRCGVALLDLWAEKSLHLNA